MTGGSRVRPVGDAALLVDTSGPGPARALAAAVTSAAPAGGWPALAEVVPGLRSVLVVTEPGTDLDLLADLLDGLAADIGPGVAADPPAPRTHRFPVVLDGEDLDEVCALAGLGRGELVALLARAVLRVAFVGFSPGFGYLEGLPEPLRAVPRRPVPRPVVPAGSVALAGGFAAVYPQPTPGGWYLIGRTGVRLFDPSTPPYALLRPGDAVRLEPVAALPADRASPPDVPAGTSPARLPWRAAAGRRPVLLVEEPGTFSMFQDAGRRGVAHLGVPGAGPADPLAHGLANRLVGNRPGAAALEVTARGPVLRCLAPAHVAVVGGGAPVTLDSRPVETGHVLPLAAGQRLAIGTLRHGLRCYLAVAGGLYAAEVLGSASTDVLARLGPGPLAAGDELTAARPPGPMADHLRPGALAGAGLPGTPTPPHVTGWPAPPAGPGRAHRILRVLPGPHPEWFPEGALAQLAGTAWAVGEASDRVGLRLRPVAGEGAPVDRHPGELDSQGMVTGAVQVPPGGEPVVLGPDHATLGGYPVVAVVISADRWVLGQCRPGDVVRMVPVTPAGASGALAAFGRAAAAAVTGRYPTVPG